MRIELMWNGARTITAAMCDEDGSSCAYRDSERGTERQRDRDRGRDEERTGGG